MNIRLYILAAFAMAALSAAASGIDDIVMEMALKNPSVAAARASCDADLADAQAENSLEGIELEGSFSSAGHGDKRWGVSIGQSFDWPGVYAARSKANQYRSEAFAFLYKVRIEQAAYDARSALIRMAAAEAEVKVLRKALENMKRMSEIVEKAFGNGDVTILEVHRLRIERFATATRCAKAEAEAESARAAVRALNGGTLPDISSFDILAPAPPLPLEHYTATFREQNPSALAGLSLARVAQQDVEVARRSALPSFKIALSHEFEDMEHFNGFSIGISLPSWSPSRKVAAARAKALAAKLDTESYELTAINDMTGNHVKASRLYSSLQEAADTFDSGAYPELLMIAYENGKLDVLSYLTEYNQYLDAAADYQAQRVELAYALAFLNRYNATSWR
ncbi:MAG: TolC family protein [Muribaculaceae bacterium]|nr:TolC family protein [Muribaculaceae bacterium]